MRFTALLIALSSLAVASSKSLNDLIAPLASTISAQVAGNMSDMHNLLPHDNSPKIMAAHRHILATIHQDFDSEIPRILKSRVQRFLRKRKGTPSDLQLAQKEALLTMQELQSYLYGAAQTQRAIHGLDKRDAMGTIQLIEEIVLKISAWKESHPEAVRDLIALEKRLAQLLAPGPDGSIASSELGKQIAKIAASGIVGKYLIFPAVFAAGAISMAAIFALFKWIMNTPISTSTSSMTPTQAAWME